jgi:hypothetical protein
MQKKMEKGLVVSSADLYALALKLTLQRSSGKPPNPKPRAACVGKARQANSPKFPTLLLMIRRLRQIFLLQTLLIPLLLLTLTPNQAPAQSKFKRFTQLPRPVRNWTLGHLWVANRVWNISNRALALTDSMRYSPELDGDFDGGKLDAFRHGIWMALLVQEIPWKKAERLGEAYERGNYLDFKRGKIEDGAFQDAASSSMDLTNNSSGREIGANHRNASEADLIQAVLFGIQVGDFVMILKDNHRNSIRPNGEVIKMDPAAPKWENGRSVVPTNWEGR